MPADSASQSDVAPVAWRELLGPGRTLKLLVLLGGVLLSAMNGLLAVTIAPSAIREFGGIAYISWLTAAYLASSIASASAGGLMTARLGARRAFIVAGTIFAVGALICASAVGMPQLIAGRLVQGAGGGLVSSLAYLLVRSTFPQTLWARAFAAISGMWGIAVLLGPLVGGLFANAGSWRDAFLVVAAAAIVLAVSAARALEHDGPSRHDTPAGVPLVQLAWMCLSVAAICVAQVVGRNGIKVLLIVLGVGAFCLVLHQNRRSRSALFPSDAFSMRSAVGVGLWLALLLSIANDPFSIYGPLFLQELHGLSPLGAGYMVAIEAMSWTLASICVSGIPLRRQSPILIGGPLIMGIGLTGIAWRMPSGTVLQLLFPIFLSGAGIGACWAFIAQRVMNCARPAEAEVAASSVAAVQLYGFAFGGAIAGLIANLIGYSDGLTLAATRLAAFWVPASFISVTLLGALAAARLVAIGYADLGSAS
jgi:MFS family permease